MARRSYLAGTIALGWAAWRLLGPTVRPRTTGIQERPPTATGRTVVVGRHEFLVREAGPADAPVLVLIHGWVYDSVATWHRIIEPLTERYRVIAIDHRNHGKTDRIRGSHDMAVVADEVAAVMDQLGLHDVAVVGYSMGGMIAQAIARRYPGMISRMVLAGTAASTLPTWFAPCTRR